MIGLGVLIKKISSSDWPAEDWRSIRKRQQTQNRRFHFPPWSVRTSQRKFISSVPKFNGNTMLFVIKLTKVGYVLLHLMNLQLTHSVTTHTAVWYKQWLIQTVNDRFFQITVLIKSFWFWLILFENLAIEWCFAKAYLSKSFLHDVK